jgi:hypothetical protein
MSAFTGRRRGGSLLWRAVPLPPHASPEQALEVREVLRALAGLPRRQYLVLYLHSLLGLSQAEVARELRVSRQTVAVHLHRARQAMRRLLGMTPAARGGRRPLAAAGRLGGGNGLRLRADRVAATLREALHWLEEPAAADGAEPEGTRRRPAGAQSRRRGWRPLRRRPR